MKTSLLIISLVLSSLSAFAADYFWIGGHGDWSDLNHWATSSGGSTLHIQLPGSSDDVYFDSNSFTGLGQVVTLDLNPIQVGNFNATGVQFFPTMSAVNFGDAMEVNGSFIMPAEMQRNMGTVRMMAESGEFNIETGGQHMGGSSFLELNGAGNFFLIDDLHVNFLYINDGTLYTNGWDLNINLRIAVYDSGSGSLNLGTSNVSVRVVELYDVADIDADEATITLQNPGFVPSQGDFHGAGAHFHRLVCQHSNQLFNDNSFDIFEALPGSVVTFEAGSTQTAGEIILLGTSNGNITLQSSITGVQTTLSQDSGEVNAEYLVLKDNNATGGATFNAITTINLGNNTGWNIDENLPENYYWVGGTGFTSDLSHWATSSGGSEFHTESPGQLDDLIFDENSFGSSSDVVTINSDATFNNLWMSNLPPDVQILASNSAIQLFVHGSVQFDEGIVIELGTVHLVGTSGDLTIEGNGSYTGDGSLFKIEAGGIYTLINDLNLGGLDINSGGLISDGNSIELNSNLVTNGADQILLDITNSTLTCRGWRPSSMTALYFFEGSEIRVITDFYSNNRDYNIVRLLAGTSIGFFEDCTISELILEPGSNVEFEGGTSITLDELSIIGTSDEMIEIYSDEPGNTYYFSKSSGSVDAYFMNISDNHAIGGATFTAHDSNLISGVSGWNIPISVRENTESGIKIYPNPSHDLVQVESNFTGNLLIHDSQGRVVHSELITKYGFITIDISSLAIGTYYLNLENSGFKTLALLKN